NHSGYAWHHGFWGLIDYWRRPKPEWFIARHVFSPVWLQTRHVPFAAGQGTVRLPVENRYSFTDFGELDFRCEIGGKTFRTHPQLASGAIGELEIPVPTSTATGSILKLRVMRGKQVVHESEVTLGKVSSQTPKPAAHIGEPTWSENAGKVF